EEGFTASVLRLPARGRSVDTIAAGAATLGAGATALFRRHTKATTSRTTADSRIARRTAFQYDAARSVGQSERPHSPTRAPARSPTRRARIVAPGAWLLLGRGGAQVGVPVELEAVLRD